MAKQNHKRLEELQALGRMLGDPAGRRWVWGILSECHVWQTSMASNALRLAFLEGERSQGLRLLWEIQEANPEMFLQMMKEYQGERRTGGTVTSSDYSPIDGAGSDADADAGTGDDSPGHN